VKYLLKENIRKRGNDTQKRGMTHKKGGITDKVLERVRSSDPYILKAREHMYIQKFDTFRNGLNQEA
jgi:hypothetical protein